MGIYRLAVFLLIFWAVLVLQGCECDAESDAELCGDRQCGTALLVDRCGDERQVQCGECPGSDECIDNFCQCEGQGEQQLCADEDFECGVHTVTDACLRDRLIDCGGCSDPDFCSQGLCICEGEPAPQLCQQLGIDCGAATVVDRCGITRELGCGGCEEPDECIDNTCLCESDETDVELCDANELACGSATVFDSCLDERHLECGGCPSNYECTDNSCQCVGQSDSELCAAEEGACGTREFTDVCGEVRQVDCGPCADGDATLGAVRDGATGELIEGATVKIYTWPPPGGSHFSWFWPSGYRANTPDFSTTTADAGDSPFNFEFGGDSLCVDQASSSELDERQWYRIVIEHPDYTKGIFYRLHGDFLTAHCPSQCPVASSSRCHTQQFELWQAGTAYPMYPDLVVDERDLESYEWQCALLPSDHTHDRLIGFRARLGAANIGQGDFHLQGMDDHVVQHIHWSDGSVESRQLEEGSFSHYDPHHHIHFMDWFRMSLVSPTDACLDVDDRPGTCLVHDGIKISYCLHDLDAFDGDVMATYDGESPRFLDPPVCDTTEQGLTPGWKDTYHRGLPGQVIIIGTPDEASGLGSLWIEGEVDPDRVLTEASRGGNVARNLVEGPDDADSLCESSSTQLDCRPPPSTWSTTQRRQCPDYINYED